jgi:hypothetical protein
MMRLAGGATDSGRFGAAGRRMKVPVYTGIDIHGRYQEIYMWREFTTNLWNQGCILLSTEKEG